MDCGPRTTVCDIYIFLFHLYLSLYTLILFLSLVESHTNIKVFTCTPNFYFLGSRETNMIDGKFNLKKMSSFISVYFGEYNNVINICDVFFICCLFQVDR